MTSARRSGRRESSNSFSRVILEFLSSDKFKNLAASTRWHYRHALELAGLPGALGDVPVHDMRPALVQRFLDALSDRPGAQTGALVAFKTLEKWAVVRDLLPYPITTGVEAIKSDGGHEPWTDEQVRLAELHARPDLARMVTLAANTGQRGSDLVRMQWTDVKEYKDRLGINVITQKTERKLWVPFTPELIDAVRTWDRSLGYLVTKPQGGPYTRPQLSEHWQAERDQNPALEPLRAKGLSFHGLRSTAVIRLRRFGLSEPLISDFIGMSGPMVHRYCRLSEQRDNAIAGLKQMGSAEVIPLKRRDIE